MPRFGPRITGLGRRGHRPRSLRLRLTLLYSALFLVSGAALLGVAYGLVAGDLGAGSARVPTTSQQVAACQQALKSPKQASLPPSLQKPCKAVFVQGASDQRSTTLHDLLGFALLALALMVVVSAALGWVISGRALRPLAAITAAARQASHTNLGDRLALQGPDDELKELADTFDAMLDRLEASFASQRRFVANASHELRTPLTVMRTAIDVTLAKPERSAGQLEEMATEVRSGIDRAESLIEALLTLARSDRGIVVREPADLTTAAEDALDAAVGDVHGGGLDVQAVFEPAPAFGDPVLLERLAANLISNAIRYNATGGWIRVTTGQRDGSAFLVVANTGPQVDPILVAGLFEPFRRLDGTGGGHGLGLAIVASVAAAHGGTAVARARGAGGLEVEVTVPLAASGSPLPRGEAPR